MIKNDLAIYTKKTLNNTAIRQNITNRTKQYIYIGENKTKTKTKTNNNDILAITNKILFSIKRLTPREIQEIIDSHPEEHYIRVNNMYAGKVKIVLDGLTTSVDEFGRLIIKQLNRIPNKVANTQNRNDRPRFSLYM